MNAYSDKVCVVTGAGSGIGRALAVQLADAGARLAISDIDAAGLEATRALLPGRRDVRSLPARRVVEGGRARPRRRGARRFGAAHYLFNNAGRDARGDDRARHARGVRVAAGDQPLGPDLRHQGVPAGMLRQGEGHIVNFSSVFGFVTVPTQSAYHVSKFGIRGFTECLSRELDGTGVCATCVHPGGIATNIGTGARFGANADSTERKFMDKMASMLRTTAEECARDDPGRRRAAQAADRRRPHLPAARLAVAPAADPLRDGPASLRGV